MSIARNKVFDCPIERALFAIGSKWKPRIIWTLRNGPVRFTDIKGSVNGLSDRMLQLHLKELTSDGIVWRLPQSGGWELIERGMELEPTLRALFDWGSRDTPNPSHRIEDIHLESQTTGVSKK